jgi:hypothetical protein
MYAILDNRGAYGDVTNYARRGILFTNSRETVVLQDEISFKEIQSSAWVVHTESEITVPGDGKTAYFSARVGGRDKYIRLTLLSEDEKLTFEKMTCGIGQDDFILGETYRPGYSESKGGVPEYDRSRLSRLVVRANNVLDFNMAVVIEAVESIDSEAPVKYTYSKMDNWQVKAEFDYEDEKDSTILDFAEKSDIKTCADQAEKLISSGYAFSSRFKDFYKLLVRVNVALSLYPPESFKNQSGMVKAYEKYLSVLDCYNAFSQSVGCDVKKSLTLARGISLLTK